MTISVKQNNTYAAATGVWVKVNGVWKQVATNGLEGLGGFATIKSVTGSPKRHAYNDGSIDWVAFEWTQAGELTTQAGGLVEALVVGAGCGSFTRYGAGGAAQQGLIIVDASPVPIKVASAVTASGQNPISSFGDYTHCGSGQRSTSHGSEPPGAYRGDDSNGGGGGARGAGGGANYGAGLVSSIKDGNPIEYAHGASSTSPPFGPNTGCGGKINQPGANGVVIVRVPAAQAAGVDPGSWVTRIDYYAEVTDGTVTDLYQERFYGDDSVRTENGRYASPEQPDDLIPCDPGVAEGWTYADGEFTPPPPDPSWREEAIEALKQQLKDLQKDT